MNGVQLNHQNEFYASRKPRLKNSRRMNEICCAVRGAPKGFVFDFSSTLFRLFPLGLSTYKNQFIFINIRNSPLYVAYIKISLDAFFLFIRNSLFILATWRRRKFFWAKKSLLLIQERKMKTIERKEQKKNK
jgi:hypothetical protein